MDHRNLGVARGLSRGRIAKVRVDVCDPLGEGLRELLADLDPHLLRRGESRDVTGFFSASRALKYRSRASDSRASGLPGHRRLETLRRGDQLGELRADRLDHDGSLGRHVVQGGVLAELRDRRLALIAQRHDVTTGETWGAPEATQQVVVVVILSIGDLLVRIRIGQHVERDAQGVAVHADTRA